MTNRDTFTPAPVGKFMFEELDQRWHHIKHGEAQFTEPRLPMVKLYGEETVRKLLEERDADKAEIEKLRVSNRILAGDAMCKQERICELETVSAAAEKLVRCKGRYHSEQNYRSLAALFGVKTPDLPPLEVEARTVSVKLPDIMPPEAAPAHYWGSGESMAYVDGYNKSAVDLKNSFTEALSFVGIIVEFE